MIFCPKVEASGIQIRVYECQSCAVQIWSIICKLDEEETPFPTRVIFDPGHEHVSKEFERYPSFIDNDVKVVRKWTDGDLLQTGPVTVIL